MVASCVRTADRAAGVASQTVGYNPLPMVGLVVCGVPDRHIVRQVVVSCFQPAWQPKGHQVLFLRARLSSNPNAESNQDQPRPRHLTWSPPRGEIALLLGKGYLG